MDDTSAQPRRNAAARHLRGSVLLVAGRVIAIMINFGVQVLTVRYLAKADYGIFAFALSVAGVLSILSAFGADKAASRFLPVYLQNGQYDRFWGMLSLMFGTVVSTGSLVVLLFVSAWAAEVPLLTRDPSTQLILALIAGLAFCDTLNAVFTALFAVLANPAAIFFRRHLAGPLLRLSAAVSVIATGGTIYAFAAAQVFAGVLGMLLSVAMLIRIVRQRQDLASPLKQRWTYPVRDLYSYSATLLAGDLGFLLRGALVPVTLGLLFAGEEVASYESVVPIARLNQFILMSFSLLFTPQAAKLAAAGREEELQGLYEKTTIWISIMSFPMFAVSFLTAESLPVLLFGPEYGSSGEILAWLAVGFYAHASFGTNLRVLRAVGTLRTLLLADFVLVTISLALVIWLVPLEGAIGGARAVCLTFVLQSLLYAVLAARLTSVHPFSPRCLAPFVAGLLLCLTAGAVRWGTGVGLAGQVALTALVTAVLLLSSRRQLGLSEAFPELARLPIVGPRLFSAPSPKANSN